MTEGRGSGELEGSTLGSGSRDGDGTRRSRRTLSSGSFLVDSSFLPKSRSLRISSHRPRRSEPDRNEKRGAPESDISVSKKRSRFPWNRHRESLGGSSVIATSAENASRSERSGSSPARQPTPPDPQPPRANNAEPAAGLDQDSLQIVNLALNLSESRRRNNIPRSVSTRLSGSGWTGASGQTSVSFQDTPTRATGGSTGYQAPHTHRNLTQTSGLPPGSRGESVTHEPSSVLNLLPNAAASETLPPVFSESTLARTERARRHFELFHLYLRLLPSLPPLRHHGMHDTAGGSSTSNDGLPPGRVYNPLQAIRDRKVRFRERRPIDPESEGWYDVDRVHAWVESIQSQYGETSHMSTECLKLPPFQRGPGDPPPEELDDGDILAASPPSSLRRISRTSSMKARRPRLDWIISPTELLADAAWVEDGQNKAKIVDNNGSLLYPNPAELLHAGFKHFPPYAESQQPGKPASERAHAPSSTASLSDAHPTQELEFKSLSRGRRRHRFQASSHGPHSRSVSMTGISTGDRRLGLRSSSASSVSTAGDKPFWYANSKEQPRVSRARDSLVKQSITVNKEDRGLNTKPLPSQNPGADWPSWAKLDGRNGSLSSAASVDQRLDPFASGPLTATSSSHVPLGYFPSIASNLSPPSSRSPSPSKRHFAHGIISRHERSKSRSRLQEVDPDRLASGAIPADDLGDVGHRARKLESSPLPDHLSPLYDERGRIHTHARKVSMHAESRLRGIFKGPGKIAERVGNEVSKMGDRILKIDTLAHSRNSSLETSVPSEGSTFDDIDETKDEKKSGAKGLLRRLPTFLDEIPRKNPERGSAKNLIPPFTTPTRRSDLDEEHRPSENGTPSKQGPGVPFYDAQEPLEKSLAATGPHRKHDVFASMEKIGDNRKFEPEVHTVREQIKKGRIKDPSVPFSMTRPPVTGLAQAEASAAQPPRDRRRDASTQSGTWSISHRSISSARDSGIPDKREIERTRALLLTSGIKAREITRRAELVRTPPPDFLQEAFGRSNPVPRVIRRCEFNVTAQGLLQRFEKTHRQLQRSVDRFPADAAPLKTQLARLEDKINHSLAPRVRAATDDADKLSVDLNTTSTLAVKQLSDKLDKSIRKRHRRLRWLRRTGFVMLEWALVGMLWWVWLIVMAFKVLRGILCGALSGIRWVLWL
ncbi:uncharacterized protein ACLA_047380 [Aspergillus clavatus NRRL 1]|uniref:Uncharacterized protein n=1 Tax=Aspergillus clavatus (strain ATCC 1007 / CBS 513.65 / DSM 816 / NCTC 3887 / NRRL 1 / QM 1276 / 107) TaxID=344612 RepID=A1CHB4_ASPCL|nr:uncharacterized protein ACLA_047380 [Aspergillus clavatus NRRL 1]EAW10269.1 conserved hypothetical protein [Aspergillus clavatus NRRL 1]